MKILVHYPFTDEQHDHLRQIARENGGHEVFVAHDDQEAIAVAGEIDIIVGNFRPQSAPPPPTCAGSSPSAPAWTSSSFPKSSPATKSPFPT